MITIISGTNRLRSSTLRLSKYYQRQFQKLGEETNIFSLEDLPPNLIVSDLYGARSEAFEKIWETIGVSEKYVFVVPEYNGSFPGVLKTFLDACKYPDSFYGKKVALVGLSSGKYGNIRGIEHFTGVCHYMHMHVLPLKIHIPHIREELDENNNLFKEDTLKFTQMQIEDFIKF